MINAAQLVEKILKLPKSNKIPVILVVKNERALAEHIYVERQGNVFKIVISDQP